MRDIQNTGKKQRFMERGYLVVGRLEGDNNRYHKVGYHMVRVLREQYCEAWQARGEDVKIRPSREVSCLEIQT